MSSRLLQFGLWVLFILLQSSPSQAVGTCPGGAQALDSLRCSQSCPATACPAVAAQSHDRWGLEFGVGQNFNLSSGAGSTLSLLRSQGAHRRLRLGISLGGSLGRGETDDEWTDEDPLHAHGEADEIETDQLNLIVLAQQQWFFDTAGKLRLFTAAGPVLKRYQTRNKTTTDQWNDSVRVEDAVLDYSTREWSVGLRGNLGAEWRFAKDFALQASYGLDLLRSWRNEERTERDPQAQSPNTYQRTSATRTWQLANAGVLLSLCAWL